MRIDIQPQTQPTPDDLQRAKAKGIGIVGFSRRCHHCGGRAFHSPVADWQHRVICLSCGKKWSE